LTVFNVFSLLGGLAFFLFGMRLLSEALEQRAGNRLQPILASLTNSNIKGVLVGVVVTGVVQSSSATTVMLVGFVNSGIMQLHQAISVIFGANIGTTITSWILSLAGIESNNFFVSLLKPSTFAPIMAFAGIIMLFVSKRKKDIATIFLGFSILMFGMELMSGSVAGLAEVPEFTQLLTLFSNPLLGVLAGALVTGIIQSSTASVGMLQALSITGSVSYAAAIPIIMGQNIGTCITAMLSSIGANKNARRVALAHLYFNIIGTVLFLIVYYIIRFFVDLHFADMPINAFGIAVFHSIFNISCTLVLFPFIRQLEKLAIKSVRDDKADETVDFVLDERLLATPAAAIDRCQKMAFDMAQLTKDALVKSLKLVWSYDEKEDVRVVEMEGLSDLYEDKLGSYLVKLGAKNLSPQNSKAVSKLLHCIGDLERISDHARNIAECAQEKNDKALQYSDEMRDDLDMLMAAVTEIVDMTINSFVHNDTALALEVEPLEQAIDTLKAQIKARHIQRLRNGLCTIELGFILSDLLTNLERVADHCSNIAICMIEVENGELNSHQHLQEIKSGQFGEAFSESYNKHLAKFELK